MEWAFRRPLLLKERLGGDARRRPRSRRWSPTALEAVFRDKPALHRYPGSMAKRTHALVRLSRRALRRARRARLERRRHRRRTAAPAARAARFRQGQGADLRRAARQAARRAAAGLGGRSPPTGRRSPTSTRTSACSRSASRRRRTKAAAEVGQGDPESRDHAVFVRRHADRLGRRAVATRWRSACRCGVLPSHASGSSSSSDPFG